MVLVSSCGNSLWRVQPRPSPFSPNTFIAGPSWIKAGANQINPFKPAQAARPANPPNRFKKIQAEVDLIAAGGSGVTGKIYLEQVRPTRPSGFFKGAQASFVIFQYWNHHCWMVSN